MIVSDLPNRKKPVQRYSLHTETSTKDFQQCVLVDSIKSGAEIEQYEDRDLAGVNVAHKFIKDGYDCGLSRASVLDRPTDKMATNAQPRRVLRNVRNDETLDGLR